MNENNILELNNVTLKDDHNLVFLDKSSFSMKRGETHAIISTNTYSLDLLLSAFRGDPTCHGTGDILFDSKVMKHVDFFKARNKITYILQENLLYEGFSVLDNIYFEHRFSLRYQKDRLRQQCQKAFEDAGFDISLNAPIESLTAEEKKIVEFFRFLLGKNHLAIVHESVLRFSADNLFKLNRLLNTYKEKGKSLLFLTSSVDDALRLADRITIMNQKTFQKTYEISEIYNSPQKMFEILSGWTMMDNVENKQYLDTFESMVQIRNISFSSYELGNVLQTLAYNIKSILKANFCNIYLSSEQDLISISSEENEGRMMLQPDFIRNILHSNTGISRLHATDMGYSEHFQNSRQPDSVLLVPVIIESLDMGLLAVGYNEKRPEDRTDEILALSLAKEISLSIETSRLLGRSMLLQESHHRIKNNLQTIINLLYMQEATAFNEGSDISRYIDAVVNRIKSMAVVHDLIAKEKTQSYITIKSIVEKIVQIYINQGIRFDVKADYVALPYNLATSIALLINELVTNSIKHAFSESSDRCITIHCLKRDNQIHLVVHDNGCGLPEGYDIMKSSSVGLSIIQSAVSELKGTLRFSRDHGTKAEISIPTASLELASLKV
ncbi:MAG: hypothetical protein KBS83_01475 [Lachnospiraceae bacterium]|nr:hypothetical protein [Candidatus Equihabitans merdae]